MQIVTAALASAADWSPKRIWWLVQPVQSGTDCDERRSSHTRSSLVRRRGWILRRTSPPYRNLPSLTRAPEKAPRSVGLKPFSGNREPSRL